MTQRLPLRWQPRQEPVFDRVAERLALLPISVREAEVLRTDFWDAGEDARLREDERFQLTPWGRWTRKGGGRPRRHDHPPQV